MSILRGGITLHQATTGCCTSSLNPRGVFDSYVVTYIKGSKSEAAIGGYLVEIDASWHPLFVINKMQSVTFTKTGLISKVSPGSLTIA